LNLFSKSATEYFCNNIFHLLALRRQIKYIYFAQLISSFAIDSLPIGQPFVGAVNYGDNELRLELFVKPEEPVGDGYRFWSLPTPKQGIRDIEVSKKGLEFVDFSMFSFKGQYFAPVIDGNKARITTYAEGTASYLQRDQRIKKFLKDIAGKTEHTTA